MPKSFLDLRRAERAFPFLRTVKRQVRQIVKRDDWIPLGSVRWGDFRRKDPICADFGYKRGKPVDRFYIEAFLDEHSSDIRGRVLEIKDSVYARRFGGSAIALCDILDIDADNPKATIIGDLGDPKVLSADSFDCIILTQTLQYLIDPAKALSNLHRALKPGGVLLLTAPGITPVRGSDHWYYSYTGFAVERLLGDAFGKDQVTVRALGNLTVATAFLHGLSAAELEPAELNRHDPAYQFLVVARAQKAMA